MKKSIFILFAFIAAFSAKAQTVNTVATPTVIAKDVDKTVSIKNENYDFGKTPFGKAIEYQLFIKNISKDSVTLENVTVGCGCTTPKFEKGKRFGPNETIQITLGFNGATEGMFSKFATLYFDGGLQKQVTFKGETYKLPEGAAPANPALEKVKN